MGGDRIEDFNVIKQDSMQLDMLPDITRIKSEDADGLDSVENLADKIDIEEHDVFSHPLLKDIFPDLSHIKREVLGDLNGLFQMKDADESANPIQQIKMEPTEAAIPHQTQETNKTLLAKRARADTKTAPKPENFNAFVLLGDIEPILNSSGCYCKECKTLFPTINALDAHNMSMHSLLTVETPTKTDRKSSTCTSNINSCNETYNHSSRPNKCCQLRSNDLPTYLEFTKSMNLPNNTVVVKNCIAEEQTKTKKLRPTKTNGMARCTPIQFNTVHSTKFKTHSKTEQNLTFSNEDVSNQVDGDINNIETQRSINDVDKTQKSTMDIREKTFKKKCFKHKHEGNNLVKHKRTQSVQNPYECKLCSKKFKRPGLLYSHLRIHTGEKPYECNECSKRFKGRADIKTHLRTHTGEKPYECKVCQKKYNYRKELKIHIRTHTGEKPYECKVCTKKFRQSGVLRIHFRIHTGEKPFECKVCTKKFRQSGVLQLHLRTHTGEKPFDCNVCLKKFTSLGSLKRHLRTHTGEKPYECNLCLKKLSALKTLKTHLHAHARKETKSFKL